MAPQFCKCAEQFCIESLDDRKPSHRYPPTTPNFIMLSRHCECRACVQCHPLQLLREGTIRLTYITHPRTRVPPRGQREYVLLDSLSRLCYLGCNTMQEHLKSRFFDFFSWYFSNPSRAQNPPDFRRLTQDQLCVA